MRALMIAAMLILAALEAASAQRLVSRLSEQEINIDSTFAGARLTMFGNVEPLGGAQRFVEGPFHIVIVIEGPPQDRAAFRASRRLGIWLNTEQVSFQRLPGFYHVLATRRLDDIAGPETLATERIRPETRAEQAALPGDADPELFSAELIRLMEEARLYGVNERAVTFQSPTFYSAQLQLPANVPNGLFLARTYLFQDGEVVSRRAERFLVTKVGLERFLGTAAVDTPLLYGLACVALAVFTGWLGGVVFRR